jgi:hypothetical protein
MADEIPSGDKAVFAFLELFALAFAFEGAAALLRGELSWRTILSFVGAIVCFLGGIRWPQLRARFQVTQPQNPVVWLTAGICLGIILSITGSRMLKRDTQVANFSLPLVKEWGRLPGECGETLDGFQLLRWADHTTFPLPAA